MKLVKIKISNFVLHEKSLAYKKQTKHFFSKTKTSASYNEVGGQRVRILLAYSFVVKSTF